MTQSTAQWFQSAVVFNILVGVPTSNGNPLSSLSYRVCTSDISRVNNATIDSLEVGCEQPGSDVSVANCLTTAVPICLESAQFDEFLQDPCMIGGACDEAVVTIEYSYRSDWLSQCCGNFTYEPCFTNDDCTEEGACCSRPPNSAVQLSDSCGPPLCLDCSDFGGDTTTISSTSATTGSMCGNNTNTGCGPIAAGTCMSPGAVDPRAGFSCANDPCSELEDWALTACGFHRPTKTFPNSLRRCSEACVNAVAGIQGCPNLADLIEAFDLLDPACENCGSHYYQRCLQTSDCPFGYCCSLPPEDPIPGFFDESTCGPPSSCTCEGSDFGFNGFTETITCTQECGPREYGTCQLIGAMDEYNIVYSCDCTDSNTFSRTGSPTEEVTVSPTTSYPTPTPSYIPRTDDPTAMPQVATQIPLSGRGRSSATLKSPWSIVAILVSSVLLALL